MKLSKKEVILILIVCIFGFILIYTPHINNRFPVHVDEWHHIDEAIKLRQGEDFRKGSDGLEFGFRVVLVFLSYFLNLVKVYQFLPALWAVISSLVLFFVVYKKTEDLRNNFFIALFSMIFFFSIRSNVNITGLWFFTPLSFSIPFIFLYFYFFSEGFEKKNKRFILISFCIMVFLLFVHAISVLFAVPILLIYGLFHYKFLLKEYKFFSIFLLIPVVGVLFFKSIMDFSFTRVLGELIHALQFRYGWGVLELRNSPYEVYSFIGYVMVFFGLFFIFYKRDLLKKYLIYVLWPFVVLFFILVFRVSGISYLSPYQRNLYYFVISLPFLSSLGVYFIFSYFDKVIKNKKVVKFLKIIFIIVLIFLVFNNYFNIGNRVRLYQALDDDGYEALRFLRSYPEGKVMAPVLISTGIFAVTEKHRPVGTIYFYGNRALVEVFFAIDDCSNREDILRDTNVRYVFLRSESNCSWNLIYNKNGIFIYEFV